MGCDIGSEGKNEFNEGENQITDKDEKKQRKPKDYDYDLEAVIEVNEEGSEASAATVVEIMDTAAAEPLTFIANRPFVFFINDDVMDTILFMGKVVSIEE